MFKYLAVLSQISKLQNRDLEDKVGYISDFDGHIIAIAEKWNEH